MRRLIASAAAIALIALTISLGNWQLRRADEKTAMQAVRDAAVASGPLEFTGQADASDALVGRSLRVEGRFDDDRTIFIDNRTHNGIAGFHVVAPLHLVGTDQVVMVLRGWVPADPQDRWRVPEVPAGDRTGSIEGLVEPGIQAGLVLGDWAPGGAADRIWPRFEAAEYAAWSGLDPYPWIVRQTNDSGDGLVRDWVRPGDSIDRHRAYALQWYSFAALFAGLWAWYGFWVPRRVRRPGGSRSEGRKQGGHDRPSGPDAP